MIKMVVCNRSRARGYEQENRQKQGQEGARGTRVEEEKLKTGRVNYTERWGIYANGQGRSDGGIGMVATHEDGGNVWEWW